MGMVVVVMAAIAVVMMPYGSSCIPAVRPKTSKGRVGRVRIKVYRRRFLILHPSEPCQCVRYFFCTGTRHFVTFSTQAQTTTVLVCP